ncbi:hypothetical protein Cantr_00829 [Candida viswanathii]|uniref:Uncharacterized protein n=1 Tax=Candida viswanathii TaxID=5486 RepID=A0A367YG53_9ASCO|nr:hypothetical protein Cantr_00829 [Candida viswanathii]
MERLSQLPNEIIDIIALRNLDLSRNYIEYFSRDSFKKFTRLRELVLEDNELIDCFAKATKTGGLAFGDDIRIVAVERNGLTKADVAALFAELCKKPKFDKLYVETRLAPQPPDTRPTKIPRLK